jgi:hypothetical protein
MTQLVTRNPLKDLARSHTAAAALPVFDESDPRFEAVLADVRARGIVQPLTIDSENRVVLGVNHWRAARALHLDEVPCLVARDGDITSLIIADLMHRAHLTKSARAYLIYPLLKEAHEEARQRAIANLKKGKTPNVSPSGTGCRTAKNIQELAAQIGVSERFFREAAEVHRIFESDEVYKTLMEPRIIAEPIGGEHEAARPVGLGAVIAGHAGRRNKGKSRLPANQIRLLRKSVASLIGRFSDWSQFDKSARAAALEEIRQVIAGQPPEVCAGVADWLQELRSEFKTVAVRKDHAKPEGRE